jgi:RimJ/RimL family protein N-acetyltransferase
MSKEIKRKMQNSDAEKMLDFFRRLVVVDQKRVERAEDVAKISIEMEEKWISDRIQKEADGEMVARCIEVDGEIIGEGEIEKLRRWIERHVAEIRFGIIPGNEDAALAMVNELIEDAKKLNIEVLQYFHLETQVAGIEIMKKAGFEEFGRAKKHYKIGAEYVDRVFLQKILK